MRGRKPKPIEKRVSEGDTRKLGVRKLQEQLDSIPKATRGLPSSRRHLSGRARKAWRFWREELKAMGLDYAVDAMMLEGACVAWSRAVLADEMIAERFLLKEPVLDHAGQVVGHKVRTHPAVAVSNAAWKQLRAFCSEFGLSPVSRTRLVLEKADTSKNDLMAMLSAPRAPRKIAVQ